MKLDELERLSKAATPGPWLIVPNSAEGKDEAWDYWHKVGPLDLMGKEPDAETLFIAAARNHLDALIRVARAAQKVVDGAWHDCSNHPELDRALLDLDNI